MKPRSLAALGSAFALGLAMFACSGGSATVGMPVTEGEVTSQSGLTISASIIAVTLGDDCPTARTGAAANCADSSESSSKSSGDFAPGGCGGGSYCQQS